jgi:hypothetical protein
MSNAGTFYTNRVLKDWKEKSQAHVAWVKAWIQARPETKFIAGLVLMTKLEKIYS